MNRILQKKVYLDEATGLPNKNKCEEILEGSDGGEEISGVYAVCVFDLNNLRTINNSLGHDKGDEYIRSFAVQLRKAVPEEYFVGRNGGDEFLAILRGLNREEVEACMNHIRTQTAEYSRQHPEMPISYAGGYALSTELKTVISGNCSAMRTRTCISTKTARRWKKPPQSGRSAWKRWTS